MQKVWIYFRDQPDDCLFHDVKAKGRAPVLRPQSRGPGEAQGRHGVSGWQHSDLSKRSGTQARSRAADERIRFNAQPLRRRWRSFSAPLSVGSISCRAGATEVARGKPHGHGGEDGGILGVQQPTVRRSFPGRPSAHAPAPSVSRRPRVRLHESEPRSLASFARI